MRQLLRFHLFSLCIFAAFASFGQTATAKASQPHPDSPPCARIINHQLAYNALDLRAWQGRDFRLLTKSGASLKLDIHPSEVDMRYTDTTYVLQSGKSVYKFCCLKNGVVTQFTSLKRAVIVDNSLALYSGIYLGMTKAQFLKLLHQPALVCDSIVVTDEEDCHSNKFIFQNGLLKKILLDYTHCD